MQVSQRQAEPRDGARASGLGIRRDHNRVQPEIAVVAAATGKLPKNAGLMISIISAVNTALALYARAGEDDG